MKISRTRKGIFIFISTLFLIFTFVGCSNSNNFIELNNWFESSGVLNNTITVNYADNSVVCKFTCVNGTVAAPGCAMPLEEVEATVNQEVSWVSRSKNSSEKVYNDYVKISLLKESKVIGYAVLEITVKDDMINYEAKILHQQLLKTPLSESEVQQLFTEIINKKGDFS